MSDKQTGGRKLEPADRVIESALDVAGPGAGAVVVVSDTTEVDLRFAVNTMTTNGVRRHRRVTVIRFSGKNDAISAGISSSTGNADIADLVAAAEADADTSAPADDAAPLLEGSAASDFAEPPAETEPAIFNGVLSSLGGAFDRAKSARRVLSGYAEHAITTTYLGTSTGLRARNVLPTGKVELVARDDKGTRSSWMGQGSADLADVDLDAGEARLAERLSWADRQVAIPAGRYQVLMPPDAVADLVIMLGDATSGREAQEGRSVFSTPGGGTRLGQSITDLPFDLYSDPSAPGLECTPFEVATETTSDVSVFDNGATLDPTYWLRGGTLERLRYHRAQAARQGQTPTPPIDNLILEVPGSTTTLDEMIASTDRALLLTCLWYIREVDPITLLLTGLTRDGVYLVEHGEIVGAVNNFRFNESPVDMLAKTVEVGRTKRALSREWNEWFNRTAMPPLRVEDFNMSSVSPAT
jgi:predicted Zn-dependent protease